MGLFRWIKGKFSEWDRRAGEWANRTAPERARKAAELRAEIDDLEEKMKRPKAKR
jgi:hypothetical protein